MFPFDDVMMGYIALAIPEHSSINPELFTIVVLSDLADDFRFPIRPAVNPDT